MNTTKDKVLEILKILVPFVKKPIESWVVKFFLNFGGTLLFAGLTTPVWEGIILGIIDKNYGTNFSQTNTILMIVLIGIALLSWSLGLLFYWITVHNQKITKSKSISIYQHSIENVVDKNTISDDEELYEIDLRFELKDKSTYGIRKAVEKQFDKTKAIHETVKHENHFQVCYYGLASVPFTMLLGYNISDKYSVIFNEWDNNRKKWTRLNDDDDYPQIVISSKNSIKKTSEVGELIIRISFTTRVEDEHIDNLSLNVLNIIDFGTEFPERGVIKSQRQLIAYQDSFRKLLDTINANYPNIKRIHMFISAQPSIVFTLGSKVSEHMDSEIVIYEHSRQGEVRYPWGLILVKECINNQDILVEMEKGELHVRHE